jgi:hypothetical protein
MNSFLQVCSWQDIWHRFCKLPIEHRLFSQISRNWPGEPLDSYQKILHFVRSTRLATPNAAPKAYR